MKKIPVQSLIIIILLIITIFEFKSNLPGIFNSAVNFYIKPFINLSNVRAKLNLLIDKEQIKTELFGFYKTDNKIIFDIYQKEYEDLYKSYFGMNEEITEGILTPLFLLRTQGIGINEKLIFFCREEISLGGFVVSPNLGTVIGKAESCDKNLLVVIPVWNSSFSVKADIYSQTDEFINLCYLESKKIFNPDTGVRLKINEKVFISKYESGGFSLERYGWNLLGRIISEDSDIFIDSYLFECKHSREEFLESRYFFYVR